MFAYVVTDETGSSEVKRLDGSPVRRLTSRKHLDSVWDDSQKGRQAKTMHNAKFDLQATEVYLGKRLEGHDIHCTHKMAHILQNHHHDLSLDNLAWELAEYPRQDAAMKRLAKVYGGGKLRYDKVPERDMTQYQIADGERGMLLFLFFWPKILANPKWLECYNVERELIWTTMRMEERGLMIRPKETGKLVVELEDKVDALQERLFDMVGWRFNPLSDDQLRRVLFKKLRLPVGKMTKKSNKPSTDKNVLHDLKETTNHPVIDLILQIRAYTRGAGTVGKYLDLADDGWIIHPTINTCRAITGRESSEHPNLQNVEKEGVLLNPYPVAARRCFRPRVGYVNIHVDYSGIEMRLLIFYSRDKKMIACLNTGDGDVHALAAAVFFQGRFTEAEKDARKVLRGATKNANFAIPYGAQPAKVAATLGMTLREGTAAFRRYGREFPDIVALNRRISQQVEAEGFVTTIFGRRLHVPRNKAYMGTNYLIQGTGAQILKRAQNRVHRYNEEYTGGEVRLLLPIHDEIVIEYPRSRLKDLPGYLKDIRDLMVDFPEFDIPLDVEAGMSTLCWAEKRELTIPD